FRRLLTAIPTLFVIVTLAFFLIRVAPGGPFNQERGLNPVIQANLEAQFGLNDPLWKQYLNYINNLLHGSFGPSYNLPDFTVGELFAKGLPISIQLGSSALILALILGSILGITAALNQNKVGDYAVIALATAGSTIPTFVIAPLIQLVFGLSWKLLPIGGWGDGALVN
ncbi:ABC transporter permease subunit, partial [Bradyrhizobium sp. 14AA]